jgi:hypothetical protein
MTYQEDLARAVREGESASRKLARLAELPDFDAFPNGTALAVVVGYPSGDPYTYLALRQRDFWYFTGGNNVAPHKATSDQVAEWMVKGPRRVLGVVVLAELDIQVIQVPQIDLGTALEQMTERVRSAIGRAYGG